MFEENIPRGVFHHSRLTVAHNDNLGRRVKGKFFGQRPLWETWGSEGASPTRIHPGVVWP